MKQKSVTSVGRVSHLDDHDIDMVAYHSDPKKRADEAVYEIDLAMRRNYTLLKSGLVRHLSPVIVIENDPHGGRFTLVADGKQESVRPVPPAFELAKSVAHIPLGIYSIIAPFLKSPSTSGWQKPLLEFGEVVDNAAKTIRSSSMGPRGIESSLEIISLARNFIDDAIRCQVYTIDKFKDFSAKTGPAIQQNMRIAAEAQITGIRSLVARWKKQIGNEEWTNLYTIVLAIWTTSERNQAAVIMKTLMDKEKVHSHLITISTAELPSDPVAVALDNLARIVQDNIAAELVFPRDQETAEALAGEEDLLSDTIESIMLCPYKENVQ